MAAGAMMMGLARSSSKVFRFPLSLSVGTNELPWQEVADRLALSQGGTTLMLHNCTISKNYSTVLSTISPTFKVYERREGGSVTARLDAIACITEGVSLMCTTPYAYRAATIRG